MKKKIVFDADAVALEAAHLETKARVFAQMGDELRKQSEQALRSAARLWKAAAVPKAQQVKIKRALRIAAYRSMNTEQRAVMKNAMMAPE